jgi:deferrochelatase/peroxidase EfeB
VTDRQPDNDELREPEAATRGTSRRQFLGGAVGAAGLVAAGGVGFGVAHAFDSSSNTEPPPINDIEVPLYGRHQPGIATAQQGRLAFAAFDVTTTDRLAVKTMMAQWAAAASLMTQGKPIGPTETVPQAPPIDTGEAIGLSPSRLTITVGFGPSFFDDRLGLAAHKPALLADVPADLPGSTSVDPAKSHGDIGVQACADDPQVAFHVIRNFARLARGTAVMRWSQLGFGRTSSTSIRQQTPRNLMGFKDGTRNIRAESAADMAEFVWVGDDSDQAWMVDGSYLVTRRIRMLVETWDIDALGDQERVFGRYKISGAPLTGKREFDRPDFAQKRRGKPVIDLNAHIRLAAPESHGGQRILRRGYSYTDGVDAETGLLDAGLFFISYQKSPEQFVEIQRLLGARDNLNEYIRHTSSAVFAVPAGLSEPGDYWGRALLA